MLTALVSRLVVIVFGTLYPAFASYKAIRTKNIQEYVKWMMYWVVFALFISAESFTDLLISWLPFYFEVKILFLVWLMSPATHGSSMLYKKFVHPWLERNEVEIDQCITRAQEQGYTAMMSLGSKGVNYATQVLVQTAVAGGTGLVGQLQRSYSVNDVASLPPLGQADDEADGAVGRQRRARGPEATSHASLEDVTGTSGPRRRRTRREGGTLPRAGGRRPAGGQQ